MTRSNGPSQYEWLSDDSLIVTRAHLMFGVPPNRIEDFDAFFVQEQAPEASHVSMPKAKKFVHVVNAELDEPFTGFATKRFYGNELVSSAASTTAPGQH